MLMALLGCGVWRLFEGEKGERAKRDFSKPFHPTHFSVFPFSPPFL